MFKSARYGRFLILAALVYLLVMVGLLTMTKGMLALAVSVVVFLAAALFQRPPQLQMHVERSLSGDAVAQNIPISVTVKVKNNGPDLDEVLVEESLPPGMILVDGKTRVLARMPHDTTLELRYTVRAPRGSYTLENLHISAGDHLGILRAFANFTDRTEIVCLPEVTQLKRVAIRPARTHGHFGPIPSRQEGSGIDFFGLRDYQMGNPRRWINWRASARHDQKLFVNQFEQERIADVGVIVDARYQSNVVLPNGGSLFEYSIQAAVSISEALLNDGNRVGLLVYGFGIERVFPGYGKVQQERILKALGRAQVGHSFALESLGYLPTRFFPAGSQIVMISPLLSEDVPVFNQLRSCGYEVLVISPDPVGFENRAYGLKDPLGCRLARIERTLLLRKLQRLGIRVLDWPVQLAFEPLVRTSLARVSQARRQGIRGVA